MSEISLPQGNAAVPSPPTPFPPCSPPPLGEISYIRSLYCIVATREAIHRIPPTSRPHLAYISRRRITLSRYPPHTPHGATSFPPQPLVLHQFITISVLYLHQQHPILIFFPIFLPPCSASPSAKLSLKSSSESAYGRKSAASSQRFLSAPSLQCQFKK